jgi:hypothetical protein
MLVRELISALQTLDGDLLVLVTGYESGHNTPLPPRVALFTGSKYLDFDPAAEWDAEAMAASKPAVLIERS